jgi:hypothetical protein
LLEPPANDFLGRAQTGLAAIAIGRIDEVDTHIQSLVQDLASFVFWRSCAKVHCTQTDFADRQIRSAKFGELHRISFS